MSPLAGVRLLRSYSAWALLVIMAVVALLAYQQYRWIAKVAEVEAKTTHEKLDASLNAFADDFDTEITRAQLVFFGLHGQTQADVLHEAHDRLLQFKKVSNYPELIAALGTDEGSVGPYMIDSESPLVLMVPTIFARPIKLESPISVARFEGTGPGLDTRAEVRIKTGVPLWLRVVLDQKYIANVVLPRLLERHLGPNARQHYDVLIHSVKNNTPVLRWGLQTGRSGNPRLGSSLFDLTVY